MDEEARRTQLRKFGVLFQSAALWSSMTLAENVALAGDDGSVSLSQRKKQQTNTR